MLTVGFMYRSAKLAGSRASCQTAVGRLARREAWSRSSRSQRRKVALLLPSGPRPIQSVIIIKHRSRTALNRSCRKTRIRNRLMWKACWTKSTQLNATLKNSKLNRKRLKNSEGRCFLGSVLRLEGGTRHRISRMCQLDAWQSLYQPSNKCARICRTRATVSPRRPTGKCLSLRNKGETWLTRRRN